MTITELKQNPNYKLLLTLQHNNLLPFIQQYVFTKTVIMTVFWFINLLILCWMCYEGYMDLSSGAISWTALLKGLGISLFLLLTLLIIVHELVHGIAYKITGAPKVSYGMNLREFYFYAVADQYVLGRKAFTFVALAPFILINLVLLLGIFWIGLEWKWTLFFTLLLHSGACAGDFGMLSFYEKNRHFSALLTFDETSKGESFFYIKE
jgi:hypothetical protein